MNTKTLLFQIIAAVMAVTTGCSTITTTTYMSKTVDVKPSGVYVGAVTFGGEVKNITGGKPVFMNDEGLLFLTRAISVRYRPSSGSSGATLYGAAERAVADINAGYESLPGDVESVNLVVFTNRLPPAGAPPALKAAGKDVTVYAVGLTEGMDSDARAELNRRLRNLAGSDSRVHTVADFMSADEEFVNTARRIAFARGKSAVVYFVLDAAPSSGEAGVEAVKGSALGLLGELSERADLTLPTPLKEIYIDEARTQESTTLNMGQTLMYWGISALAVGLVVLLSVLVINAGDSGDDGY